MSYDIWGDSGELNQVFQKHVLAAVKAYFNDGFWSVSAENLSIRRYLADPLDGVFIEAAIVDVIDGELRQYVDGRIEETVDIMAHDFEADRDPYLDGKRENLIKLQKCLRILKGA